MYVEPTAVAGAGLERPVEKCDSLSHSCEAAAPTAGRVVVPLTVVDDIDRNAARAVRKAYLHGCTAGVLERVRQRLLDDAVRGEVDRQQGSGRGSPSIESSTSSPAPLIRSSSASRLASFAGAVAGC